MRRIQHDYNNTGNMKLRTQLPRIEAEIDAAIIQFEMQWEKEQPKQMELPNLFPTTTPNLEEQWK